MIVLCSENKGTDQQHMKKAGFLKTAHIRSKPVLWNSKDTDEKILSCSCSIRSLLELCKTYIVFLKESFQLLHFASLDRVVVVVLGFYVPPTANVIQRLGLSLMSHPKDWRSNP